MINKIDQEILLKLIAKKLSRNIECMAVGGTAMMFQNYKELTKDIDLIFFSKEDRDEFIRVIKEMSYEEKSVVGIYEDKKANDKDKPLMFTKGEERFDLFVKNIFGIIFDEKSKENIVERRDFIGEKELRILIPPIEYIILLKAITKRKKDSEDIQTILNIEKNIDWDLVTNVAIEQRKNKDWILLDLEKTMQNFRKEFLITQKYFDKIYDAEESLHK